MESSHRHRLNIICENRFCLYFCYFVTATLHWIFCSLSPHCYIIQHAQKQAVYLSYSDRQGQNAAAVFSASQSASTTASGRRGPADSNSLSMKPGVDARVGHCLGHSSSAQLLWTLLEERFSWQQRLSTSYDFRSSHIKWKIAVSERRFPLVVCFRRGKRTDVRFWHRGWHLHYSSSFSRRFYPRESFTKVHRSMIINNEIVGSQNMKHTLWKANRCQ